MPTRLRRFLILAILLLFKQGVQIEVQIEHRHYLDVCAASQTLDRTNLQP